MTVASGRLRNAECECGMRMRMWNVNVECGSGGETRAEIGDCFGRDLWRVARSRDIHLGLGGKGGFVSARRSNRFGHEAARVESRPGSRIWPLRGDGIYDGRKRDAYATMRNAEGGTRNAECGVGRSEFGRRNSEGGYRGAEGNVEGRKARGERRSAIFQGRGLWGVARSATFTWMPVISGRLRPGARTATRRLGGAHSCRSSCSVGAGGAPFL